VEKAKLALKQTEHLDHQSLQCILDDLASSKNMPNEVLEEALEVLGNEISKIN
jgi:hypothetical protein